MRNVVKGFFYNGNLMVDLRLTGLGGTEFLVSGKVDTGTTVGLVLPNSYRDAIVCPGREPLRWIPCKLADCSTTSGEEDHVDAQLRCDDGSYWPQFPGPDTRTRVIILPREAPALVGVGLWTRWRIDMDGPAGSFSIWVPDGC